LVLAVQMRKRCIAGARAMEGGKRGKKKSTIFLIRGKKGRTIHFRFGGRRRERGGEKGEKKYPSFSLSKRGAKKGERRSTFSNSG